MLSELLQLFLEVGEALWQDGKPISLLPCSSGGIFYLYYKRGDPYLCSAKAPVLEGSGSRRLYRLKGTRVDRVYVVFGTRVDLGFFLLFVKNGFVVGVRSLKVPVRHCNSHYVSATRRLALDNRQFNSPNTYTHMVYIEFHGSRQAGRQGKSD